MKKDYNNSAVFLVLLLLPILAGCTNAAYDSSKSNADNVADDSDQGQSLDSQSTIQNANSSQALAISPRCTGCGRCVQVDSEHFSYNAGSRIPKVVSQDNLDSSQLQSAIRMCMADAISIKEGDNI